MNRFKRYRPTPAMIVAIVALVFALGGTSYAAVVLPAGSVGSKQIKKNAVTGAKIKANSVTTVKIKDGAVTTPKLADGAVTTPKLADGSVTTAKLADGAVATAKIANDAVTGDKVLESSLGKVPSAASADNASAVGGYAAASLARVGMASNSASVSTATATVATVSLTAPTAGFVLVQGWVTASSANGVYYVRVWDDTGSAASPYYNGCTATGTYTSVGNTTVFQVAAGARTYSVRVEASTAGSFTAHGTITAQFVPFGSTGSPTSLSSQSTGHGPAQVIPQP